MTSTAPGARTASAILAAATVIHLVVVGSILSQPLNVNAADPSRRSIIWPLHNDTVHRDGPGMDLFATYNAGVYRELRHSPYDPKLARPGSLPYWSPFRYLPIVAETLGRALASVPPRTAWLAWAAILEMAVLGLCLLFRLASPVPWLRWAAPCFLLVSSPYFLELHMGQSTFITAALFLFALWLCESSQRGPAKTLLASISYATAILLEIVPLVGIPALLRTRRGVQTAVGATTIVLLGTVPLFLAHPRWWESFSEDNLVGRLPVGGGGNFGLMFVIYQAASDLGVSWTVESWSLATRAAQLLFLGGAAAAAFFGRTGSVLVGGAALYLGHTLSYFHVWEHHMSGVIVLGVGLLAGLETARSSPSGNGLARGWNIAAVLALVALALPTPNAIFDRAADPKIWDPTETWPAYARYLVPLSKAAPVVVLYGVAMRAMTVRGLAWPWRKTDIGIRADAT